MNRGFRGPMRMELDDYRRVNELMSRFHLSRKLHACCRFAGRGLRCVWPAALIGWGMALCPAAALAEGTSGIAGPHGDTWPALLVILCLALGLVLLVRSSYRHAESKLEKLDEE